MRRDRLEAKEGLVWQAREGKAHLREAPAAERPDSVRCCTSSTSFGLRTTSTSDATTGAERKVRAPRASRTRAGAAKSSPSSNSRVAAIGTRLRRRLSRIFQRASRAKRVLLPACALGANAWQEPMGDLPIATNPAPPANHVRAVARRINLVQLDIGDQSRARKHPSTRSWLKMRFSGNRQARARSKASTS